MLTKMGWQMLTKRSRSMSWDHGKIVEGNDGALVFQAQANLMLVFDPSEKGLI